MQYTSSITPRAMGLNLWPSQKENKYRVQLESKCAVTVEDCPSSDASAGDMRRSADEMNSSRGNAFWLNETSVGLSDAHEFTSLEMVEIASLAVIFTVSVLGNGAVLLSLYRRHCTKKKKKKLSRIFFFILHLTVADLVTAMLNVLPQLLWKMTYRFAGGSALCKAVKVGQTLGPYLISYILVATAIDRYQAICHPLSYCSSSSRKSRTMIVAAWVLSLVFCIPQMTIFSYQELSPTVRDCWASFARPWGERIYVTWYSASMFIIPLLLMLGTYSRIYQQIWRSANIHQSDSQIMKARVNTIKQTVTVIVIYIVCSTPFICALLWASWDNDAHHSNIWSGSTLTVLTLLASINSCVNPLVYIGFNPALRRSLSGVFGCHLGGAGGLAPRGPKARDLQSTATMLTRIEECNESTNINETIRSTEDTV